MMSENICCTLELDLFLSSRSIFYIMGALDRLRKNLLHLSFAFLKMYNGIRYKLYFFKFKE